MGVVFDQVHAMKTVLLNCRTVFVARGLVSCFYTTQTNHIISQLFSQLLLLSAKSILFLVKSIICTHVTKDKAQASTGRWLLSTATCLKTN